MVTRGLKNWKLKITILLEKEIFPEIPARIEYKLTPYGNSVVALLHMMSEWGGKHWYLQDHAEIEVEV
jgi:DNA-binding HxlR family transcriptional regulator